jgi:hypothetical protein
MHECDKKKENYALLEGHNCSIIQIVGLKENDKENSKRKQKLKISLNVKQPLKWKGAKRKCIFHIK